MAAYRHEENNEGIIASPLETPAAERKRKNSLLSCPAGTNTYSLHAVRQIVESRRVRDLPGDVGDLVRQAPPGASLGLDLELVVVGGRGCGAGTVTATLLMKLKEVRRRPRGRVPLDHQRVEVDQRLVVVQEGEHGVAAHVWRERRHGREDCSLRHASAFGFLVSRASR